MNEDQLREYIELQRELINALLENHKSIGWTIKQLDCIKKLEKFEDSLPCNQEQ